MNKLIKIFIFKIIIITLILALSSGSLYYFLIPKLYFNAFPLILLLFPIVSSVIHIQLLKSSQKSLARFNIAFMLSFMLKMIAYIAFSATIISLESENRMSFVITIMLFYIIYTVFDVKMILKDMKTIANISKSEK